MPKAIHEEIMVLKGVEEPAARLLKSTLEKLGVHADWRPGDDPPDVVFEVEGRGNWAVEVTELHQYVQLGKRIDSRAAVTEPLIKMCDHVQAEIADCQNRDYLITGLGPVTSPPLREIERRAVTYIREGGSDERILDDGGRIRIRAIASKVRVGWAVGLDARAGSAAGSVVADVRANVQFALDRVLDAKLPKLAGLTGYDRKILLIWKDYLFADPEMVQELLAVHGLTKEQVDTVLFATETEIHWVVDPGRVFA